MTQSGEFDRNHHRSENGVSRVRVRAHCTWSLRVLNNLVVSWHGNLPRTRARGSSFGMALRPMVRPGTRKTAFFTDPAK